MKVTLLDTETGEKKEVEVNCRPWDWVDGNYSDDCNRIGYFGEDIEDKQRKKIYEELLPEHPEVKDDENICLGSERILLIEPLVFEPESEGDLPYTARAANRLYPEELIEKYLP